MKQRERTMVLIKPGAVQRGLIHKVIIKLENHGFKLVAMKFFRPSREFLEEYYGKVKHIEKVFQPLIRRMMSGPIVAMVWEGDNVIKTCFKIRGATCPWKAEPGTLRGDYS